MKENNESEELKNYFESIEEGIRKEYEIAENARKKGFDPEDNVEIPVARNMAERVEGLISVIAPNIVGSGVSDRIKELEDKYGSMDWRVGLIISLEVAREKFCTFKDKKEAMEIGIRAGIAYLTSGIVASPLEGFVEIRLRKRKDGKEYFALSYAGPIRSAGGTASAVSVILADYVRKNMGYHPFDPTEDEINRTVTELYDYHERITNLQYLPSEEEIKFLAKNLPVQIDGEPSEKIEVSNYKDLDRVDTNNIRNGLCLVLGEGVAQKAKKVWKQISKWGKDFGLDEWMFLGEFLELQARIKANSSEKNDGSEKPKISPDYTFIKDLVAGRPVFTHPMRHGGFRLRYGRARTSGYSACCINPASMHILNKYIASGTQLKLERPGKAGSITSCSTVEGPIVKLEDGSVEYVESLQKAKELKGKVQEILYLGDILINYGDFFNRAHMLVPPGYCEEWWILELEKFANEKLGSFSAESISSACGISIEKAEAIIKNPLEKKPDASESILLSRALGVPLHPYFTYHWNAVSAEELAKLNKWMKKANIIEENGCAEKIILPIQDEKRILELAGIPHVSANNEYAVIEKEHAPIIKELFRSGFQQCTGQKCSDILSSSSGITLRDKSGVFVGARMGRPEKAKMRKLTGSPQVLFPVGDEGGRFRCFQEALETGKVKSSFPIYKCSSCSSETIYRVCERCGKKAEKLYFCRACGAMDKKICPKHGENSSSRDMELDIKYYFNSAKAVSGVKNIPELIKGVKGTSNRDHTPEHLSKGILRAVHQIYVNKDGTTRYDMTQLPLTHFKPKEVGTPIEKLKEIGYKYDVYGKELSDENQILELKPQDIVLPECDESPDEGAGTVLLRVADFMDNLLEKVYGLERFYNAKKIHDLSGQLVVCLAPHTSAGIVGRIVGFSKTQGFMANPMIHAATRRDCDGDEACVSLLLDTLVNFSRHYLPAHRGSTQDAPLVLTSVVIPKEVDDMVFDVDFAWKYPLEFYEACTKYMYPWDVKVDQMKERLGTYRQFCGFGFTHDTDNMNNTVRCSAYKTLPSMEEKLLGQMDIAEKARSVETSDVARLVIEKHFLKDTKGNLRKFSMQQFRCVSCNDKYRRPPLAGKCRCGGKIIFTISEGSVVKYLEPSLSLAKKYNLPPYLKQTLILLQRRVEDVFGKEKEKQEGLGKWFG